MGYYSKENMSLKDFIDKNRQVGASPTQIAKRAVSELDGKLNQHHREAPKHLPDQRDLIQSWFTPKDEPAWLLFFDAGRYDIFDQLVWDYFDGNLSRTWNGGVGYTGDWTVRNLTWDFGNRGLFSYVPLRGFGAAEYDGRNWFSMAPDIGSEHTVHERLAELGYREKQTEDTFRISPRAVNKAVLNQVDALDGGVIRYLAPHPPFEGLEDLTSESTKTAKTRDALQSGELTYQELTEAYINTYKIAFDRAVELIPQLPGRVVITADHGTCLTCGQLFHGRRLEKHDHLSVVPWFEVDRVL